MINIFIVADAWLHLNRYALASRHLDVLKLVKLQIVVTTPCQHLGHVVIAIQF